MTETAAPAEIVAAETNELPPVPNNNDDDNKPTIETPMEVTIGGETYSNVFSLVQDDRGTFMEYFSLDYAGPDASQYSHRLAFWTRGIHGTMRFDAAMKAGIDLEGEGKMTAAYVPRHEWGTGYNCLFIKSDPNWAVLGKRGYRARHMWGPAETNFPPIEAIAPSPPMFIGERGGWDYFTTGRIEGEPFAKFHAFLAAHPHLDIRAQLAQDEIFRRETRHKEREREKKREEKRVAKREATNEARLAKKRARQTA